MEWEYRITLKRKGHPMAQLVHLCETDSQVAELYSTAKASDKTESVVVERRQVGEWEPTFYEKSYAH